jgi:hypothetical protein
MGEIKGSSYEKIYQLLLDTPEGRAIQTRVKTALESSRVKSWFFQLRERDSTQPVAVACFKSTVHAERHFELGAVWVDIGAILTHDELVGIVHRHFDRDIPTYFCRRKVVEAGCRDERGRKTVKSFSAWAQEYIGLETADLAKMACQSLESQCSAIAKNPGFIQEHKDALTGFAKDEIGKVIKRYAFLGEPVLRDALQDFAVSSVLDS